MSPISSVIADLQSALSVTDLMPLTQGGQKVVLSCKLEGNLAVAKVVGLPPEPDRNYVLERAEREVEILATVDSPHVVRVLSEVVELSQNGGPPYAVAWLEEYLDGVDLRSELNQPWDPSRTAKLIAHVATGLAAFHDLDVVHRDLSPGNVRQLANGSFSLMDPGLARHLAKSALTGIYQPGTHGYRSPEHVPGGDVQPASDIYVLGILAYQSLTGALPIDPTGPEDAYFQRLRTYNAPQLRTQHPSLPSSITSIIDRCLQRQPARRFLDGQELLAELENIGDVYLPFTPRKS